MAAVRAIQRRNRIERVLAQHEARHRAGTVLDGDLETIAALREMREELAAEMRAEGQRP